jgi:hypothetical protein
MMVQTKLSFYLLAALYILTIHQATAQEQDCQVCDNSSSPDLLIPFTGNVTCEIFYQGLAFSSAEECATILAEIPWDLPSWCGCENAEASGVCEELCKGDLELIDAELEIPDSDDGFTCGSVADIAPYVSNEDVCGQILLARTFCCVRPNFSLCPDGSPITLPDRKLGSSEEDIGCREINQMLSTLDEVQTKTFLAENPLDLPSWCGCEGAEAPNLCPVCGDGEQLTNEDSIIIDSDGLTCAEGEVFSRHVKSTAFCQQQVKPANALCCEAKDMSTAEAEDEAEDMSTAKAEDEAEDMSTADSAFLSHCMGSLVATVLATARITLWI